MILAQSAAVQQFAIGLSYSKGKIKFFLIRYICSRTAGVLIPKFAWLGGKPMCELRNQRDTRKAIDLV
jgi:hypothetical protein